MRMHDEGFYELERDAMAIMKSPSSMLPQRTSLECVTWCFPSFEPYLSWSVLREHGDADRYTVLELTWNRPGAYEQFISTRVPTIEQAERLKITRRWAPLDAPEIARHLVAASDVRVALRNPKAPIGLDGVSYGITLPSGFGGMTLAWWSDGPASWRDAVRWCGELRDCLRQALSREGSSMSPFDPTWLLHVTATDSTMLVAMKILREERDLRMEEMPALRANIREGAPVMIGPRSIVERVAVRLREAGVDARVVGGGGADR